MVVRIVTDVPTLARSRFATSPAFDIVATLRGRHSATLAHARHWYARAQARLDPWTLELLHALVPADHPYIPDFLTPQPAQPRETRDRMVAAITATPADQLTTQLDHLFAGRQVHPHLADAMGGEATYRHWRRRMSAQIEELLEAGTTAFAAEVAGAMGRFFDVALAEDWAQVADVLDADIAHRAEVTSSRGIAATLATFGTDLRWDGRQLTYPSRFEVTVDWADDGLLFVPCVAHTEPILFRIDPPHSPILMYTARGTATLRQAPRPDVRGRHLGALLGGTRLSILLHLAEPRTTTTLSRLDGHSVATISYHLGVLARSGLVAYRREGRGVLYRRTALGEALLHGELPSHVSHGGAARTPD